MNEESNGEMVRMKIGPFIYDPLILYLRPC